MRVPGAAGHGPESVSYTQLGVYKRQRQVRLYSAPGRTELGGNHTDHQHGYGLAAAVTLDLLAVASPSEMCISDRDDSIEFYRRLHGWSRESNLKF